MPLNADSHTTTTGPAWDKPPPHEEQSTESYTRYSDKPSTDFVRYVCQICGTSWTVQQMVPVRVKRYESREAEGHVPIANMTHP